MNARASFGLVTAAVALTLGACSGGGESAKPAAAASPQAAAPAAAAPAAAPAATTAAAPAAVAEFGVPECDDYLTKYIACIDSKVPEAARATVRQALDQTKAAVEAGRGDPPGQGGPGHGLQAGDGRGQDGDGRLRLHLVDPQHA